MKEDDEKYIKHILNYLEELDYDRVSSNEIVGYNCNGLAVDKSALMHNIKECEKNVSNGEFFTFDELERQSQKW